MLRMVSITKEFAGYAGRDQIVYNSQFTVIHDLINMLYKELPVEDDTCLIVNDDGDFNIFTPLDKQTRQRTLRTYLNYESIFPNVYSIRTIRGLDTQLRPTTAYYVNFPWMATEQEIHDITPYYKIGNIKKIEYGGYSISAYELKRLY